MKRTTLFSMFLIAALGIVMAGPVNATDYSWIGAGSAAYHTAANWSPGGGPPGTTDKATIDPADPLPLNYLNPVLDDQDRSLGELVIGSGFKLTVTGVKLTLEGNTQTFNGNLVLSNGTAIVKFTGATVTASGSSTTGIKGENNGAKIQIEGGDTLTSTMLIQGHMAIETNGGTGNGTFKNGSTGIVRANAVGTLRFAAGLTLDDDASTSLWEAKSDSSAVLKFDEDATNLIGKFVLCKDATFQFADGVDISTAGCFIVAAANGFLDFLGTPGSFHTDDITCSSGGAGNWSADHEFTGTCTD